MKNKRKSVECIIVILFALSCGNKQTGLEIKIEKVFITNAVSSGSGLAFINDSIFIVGDDADFIGKLSLTNFQYTRVGLYANAPVKRIDRSIKHDLESCTLGIIGNEIFLFAFSSGGISPYRDTLFVLSSKDANKNFKRSILPLYNAVKARAHLKEDELNIEGAAFAGDKLFLFNRGKNLIISLQWGHFIKYLLNDHSPGLPPFNILNVSLPAIDGVQMGFSGACALSKKELLFTASLEETTDFTKDGNIKGSYIGILKLVNDTNIKLISFSNLKSEAGDAINDKLESIEVIKVDGKNIESIAVADNDDGTSKIYHLNIKKP